MSDLGYDTWNYDTKAAPYYDVMVSVQPRLFNTPFTDVDRFDGTKWLKWGDRVYAWTPLLNAAPLPEVTPWVTQ